MTPPPIGGRLTVPGTDAALANHEARVRALERQPLPDPTPTPTNNGSVSWLIGGYSGAILAESSLLAYYRLGADATHTDLQDFAPPPIVPADLTVVAGATPVTHGVAGPPRIADGNFAIDFSATNPNNSAAASTGQYLKSGVAVAKYNVTTWSAECWLYINPAAQGNIANVVNLPWGPIIVGGRTEGTDGPGTANGWMLAAEYLTGSNPKLVVVGATTEASQVCCSSLPIAIAGWYHVVVTNEQDNSRCCLYINGALAAQGSTFRPSSLGGSAAGAPSLQIGGLRVAFGVFSTPQLRNFVGTIDEVAFYNVALSQAQVLAHYNSYGLDTDPGHWVTVPAGALVPNGGIDTSQLADRSVTEQKIALLAVGNPELALSAVLAANIDATLKPSGGALAGTEALRAIGKTGSTAMAGNDARLLGKASPIYSASITPDAFLGGWQTIVATNGTAFTINAPTNPPSAAGTQELTIEISNTSGGALGAITWNAAFVFTNGAFVAPANTMKRFVTFGWNGAAWIEKCRANADY